MQDRSGENVVIVVPFTTPRGQAPDDGVIVIGILRHIPERELHHFAAADADAVHDLVAQRLQRLAAQFAADRAAEVDPARHGASRLATARFDQLMIMHLRLRRIPQAARLAAVDRQRSLRLGIAAEAARIRIILQRAAEIARAADRSYDRPPWK